METFDNILSLYLNLISSHRIASHHMHRSTRGCAIPRACTCHALLFTCPIRPTGFSHIPPLLTPDTIVPSDATASAPTVSRGCHATQHTTSNTQHTTIHHTTQNTPHGRDMAATAQLERGREGAYRYATHLICLCLCLCLCICISCCLSTRLSPRAFVAPLLLLLFDAMFLPLCRCHRIGVTLPSDNTHIPWTQPCVTQLTHAYHTSHGRGMRTHTTAHSGHAYTTYTTYLAHISSVLCSTSSSPLHTCAPAPTRHMACVRPCVCGCMRVCAMRDAVVMGEARCGAAPTAPW